MLPLVFMTSSQYGCSKSSRFSPIEGFPPQFLIPKTYSARAATHLPGVPSQTHSVPSRLKPWPNSKQLCLFTIHAMGAMKMKQQELSCLNYWSGCCLRLMIQGLGAQGYTHCWWSKSEQILHHLAYPSHCMCAVLQDFLHQSFPKFTGDVLKLWIPWGLLWGFTGHGLRVEVSEVEDSLPARFLVGEMKEWL